MRSFTVEGVVIKRSNIGEADRLVTLFTRSEGKVIVIAKGIRKLKSKRAGSLELFNLVKAQIIPGKGQIDTLAEVQSLDTFRAFRKHLGRVTLAYQMCEAIDKLTPDRQPHPQVFNILVTALSQISHLGANWEEQIKFWLVEIVKDLGFYPKDQNFDGSIIDFVEEVSSRSYNSPKLLKRLF